MQNFDYSIPTKIYFGKGQIEKLKKIKELGDKVLLVYGGGSIKRNGIYDKVMEIFKENNIQVKELSGIDPNPRIESVREGVKICREENIDVILAVGGGSTIDCSKVIAAGALYDGDPWDLVVDPNKIVKALPIVSILTIAATGSEMDAAAVISDLNSNNKIGTRGECLKPTFSILDPEYTYSVPKKHTAAGTADIMSHTFENYFTKEKDAYIQARFCESVLRTCIKYGPIALNEPDNYEARANLMWASSLAINGILSYGAKVAWSVHAMEHELSAFYDITHGEGLAILTPVWMEYVLSDETMYKFVEFGTNVWGIDKNLPDEEIARTAIKKTREFFNTMGLPATLGDVNIGEENLEKMAAKLEGKYEDTFVPLTTDQILEIFKRSL